MSSAVAPLCILTVHAHPDDEASKGAPTMAWYNSQGVRTVLVCCTGGEEGDLQNPALRDEGGPFHGMTTEEEKQHLARIRPVELAQSAQIIGFDQVIMLGYRDSGMADSPPNENPSCFHQASLDEAVGRLVSITSMQSRRGTASTDGQLTLRQRRSITGAAISTK
jgi:mycothiol S-conjugate amidase